MVGLDSILVLSTERLWSLNPLSFNNNNNKILLVTNISNYISFPPQIAYKLIEAGRSKDILQIQGLSIDGLNNRENTTYTIHRIE